MHVIAFLVIALVSSQVQLPQLCTTQCTPFSQQFSHCASQTLPVSPEQWNQLASTAASCVCPVLGSDTTCQMCLMMNYASSPSTRIYSEMKSDCNGNQLVKVANTLLTVWGHPGGGTASTVGDPGSPTNTFAPNSGAFKTAFFGIAVLMGSLILV